MAEPSSAGALAASISITTLAMLGVDYYSLLYGLVGALLALSQAGSMGRSRAVVYVSLATLVGAVIGTAVLDYYGSKSRPLLIIGCLLGGMLAQAIVAAVLKAGPVLAESIVTRIKSFIDRTGGV